MNIDIKLRQNKVKTLHNYLKDVDTEITMILQNLQWDRKYLAEDKAMVVCQYDKGHRVPPDKLAKHENSCFLKNQGYFVHDSLLPSPVDPGATTVIKLSGDNIVEIIKNASSCQPAFNLGAGCSGQQPLTLERLQATYTADERRAIHDAVVTRVPSCHDLSDLALLSKDESGKESKTKSKLEILAELRDMRRRRTKYRVAAKTRNYSDVLRDVISTQMDLYTQANNSSNQNRSITKNVDADSNKVQSETKSTAIEKYTVEQFGNTLSRKRQISTSTFDEHNNSRHSRQYKEHDSRIRRHNESDNIDNSTSGSSKTDYDRDHYSSKTTTRNYEYYREKDRRERHKHHERYDSRNKHREKEYDRKGNTRAARKYSTLIKDKAKDRCYVDSKYKEKHRSKDRHSKKVKKEHDKHENTKLSPRSRDATEGQKVYETRREQIHAVKIKKERDDCYDDNCYNSDKNETDYTDITSRDKETYSGMTNIKVEKDYHLQRVENIIENDRNARGKDYRSKSSDTFSDYTQSKMIYDGHVDSSTYKDNYYGKRKDKMNYTDIRQQKRIEQDVQKIKLKKDEQKPLDASDSRRESRAENECWNKNKNEKHERADEYRRDKIKE